MSRATLRPAQGAFDFDALESPSLPRTPSEILFAPSPADPRALAVLQIARDLDALRQDPDLVAPDREFYLERIAMTRRSLR
ncbi:MAG: hypothetical protein ABFD60_01535 [Bryobacteraceae bacterium]